VTNFFLGVDMGTGGCKAALINDQGDVLGYGYREYPIITEKPSWSEHEPELYWKYVCELIKLVLKEGRVSPNEVKGIGVSSALPAMVMIDENGNPLQRAYNLMDRRATAEVEWIKQNIGEQRVYKMTGYRLEDHPSMVNLLWEKRNRPETYHKIYKALTIGGYIIYRLTGKTGINRSDATFFGAYDLRKNQFDQDIVDRMGLEHAMFPEIHLCEDVVGEVHPSAASECGLVTGIPVAGQADAMAGWIGAGAIDIGDFQSNLGTVGNFGIIHRDYDFVESKDGYLMGITCPYTIKDTLVTIPTTMTGGQTLRFLRDTIAQSETQIEKQLGVSAYDLMTLQASKAPIGSDGLVVLPLLMGERSPLWDPFARGVMFGLSLNHTKGHMIRAMMEGVAFAMYSSFRVIKDCGLKINYPMVMNEGGAVSRLWREIITDVFNLPTVLVKRRTGAPFGDGILAGVAAGIFKDFSIAKDWTEYVDLIEPNEQNHQNYMRSFEIYRQIYPKLKDEFRNLALLRDKA
jgi:ribulokinase